MGYRDTGWRTPPGSASSSRFARTSQPALARCGQVGPAPERDHQLKGRFGRSGWMPGRRSLFDMRWMVGAATARLRLSLAIVVGGFVALLMPSLLTALATSPSVVVLAAVAVAVAGVVVLGGHVARFVPRAVTSRSGTTDGVPSCLAGALTDPRHHPLRPRAPGLV